MFICTFLHNLCVNSPVMAYFPGSLYSHSLFKAWDEQDGDARSVLRPLTEASVLFLLTAP